MSKTLNSFFKGGPPKFGVGLNTGLPPTNQDFRNQNITDNYKKTGNPGQYYINPVTGNPTILSPAYDDRYAFNPYNPKGKWSYNEKRDDQNRRSEQSKAMAAAEAARQQMLAAVEGAQRNAMGQGMQAFGETYNPYANNLGNMITAYSNQEGNRFGANAMMEAARQTAAGNVTRQGMSEVGQLQRGIMNNLADITGSQHSAQALMNQTNQQQLANMHASDNQARGNLGQSTASLQGQAAFADAQAAAGIAPYAIRKLNETTRNRESGGTRLNNIQQTINASSDMGGDFGGLFGGTAGGPGFQASGPSGTIMSGGYGGTGAGTGGGQGGFTGGSQQSGTFSDTGSETYFDNDNMYTRDEQIPDELLAVIANNAFGGIQRSRDMGQGTLDRLAGEIGAGEYKDDMNRNYTDGMDRADLASQRMFDYADANYNPMMNQLQAFTTEGLDNLNQGADQYYQNTQTDPRMYQQGFNLLTGGLNQTQAGLKDLYAQLAGMKTPMNTLDAFYRNLDKLNYRA
jgi:hypothetical protein|tara:strand:- start:379 stop:1920 length:1542 start_codon:yes stop_codon:yes gene_type:complete